MSKIHSINTKPELSMARELKRIGIKFKRQYSAEGRPDFAFPDEKIAVFCDGDFWHGNSWRIRGYHRLGDDIKHNRYFWMTKIRNNIMRDRRVNRELRKKGWLVLRFWESIINADVKSCAQQVKEAIRFRKKGRNHAK